MDNYETKHTFPNSAIATNAYHFVSGAAIIEVALQTAHALEGERVKVCPPFTRGQVFETCNFFLLRSLYSLFFLLLLLFYTIVLYFIFSFLSNYVILFIYFKTIYKCRNTYRILQKIITKFLHTSPIQTVYI